MVRLCKLFCLNIAKVRAINPSSLEKNLKLINDFKFNPNFHKSIKFYIYQEKYNTRRIQREVQNISCLEAYKAYTYKICKLRK